jgi:5'(3')-deoxyribonucleotidase
MSERRFVLGVDLDGVCADFYSGLRPIAAEWLEVAEASLTPEVSFNLAEWGVLEAPGGYDALHKFAVTQRELFQILRPIAGAATTLRRLSKLGLRIRIITNRLCVKYFHQQAVAQTVAWLDHWDIPYWDLCLLQDKTAVGADLYIEDAPQNVQALLEEGQRVIIFTNSTNRQISGVRADDWGEVERLVLRELESWRHSQRS